MTSNLKHDAYFVDTPQGSRVLCHSHRQSMHPKADAIAVTDDEQKQAVLFYGARIKCEECTGNVL